MEYEEFARKVHEAGLTIRAFAAIVSLNPNSLTNYKKKNVVPNHVAVIVTLMAAMKQAGLDPEEALRGLALPKNAPRGRSLHPKAREASDETKNT